MKAPLYIIFTCFITLTFAEISRAEPQANLSSANPPANNIYQFANQCFSIISTENAHHLSKQNGAYAFSKPQAGEASKFYMRPAALGVYLLYDQDKQYLIANEQGLSATSELESEMTLNMPEKDYLITAAEWALHSTNEKNQFHFKHIKSNSWLGTNGLNPNISLAEPIKFQAASGCAEFPEAKTGATGKVTKTQHEDGLIWGFADAHEHMGANHGFGGKLFHGTAFHKLGIEHALADCEKHHGENGSNDLLGVIYKSGSGKVSVGTILNKIFAHLVRGEADHDTKGYPEMNDWIVHTTPTHQSLYYKWIERSYLGGMRVMVEYMESTEVVCELYKSLFPSESDVKSCNEMGHIDHQVVKIKELQDYVDAQSGGPGKGWFRIVYSPEEAREVVEAGKLAVIMGIEMENPFDCFIDERDGFETCNDDMVRKRLNAYYDKGVRALFPSHKFVNAFSSGDGNPGILELGDYGNSGQWRQYAACEDVPGKYTMQSHGEGKLRSMFSKLPGIPGMQTLNEMLSDENDPAKQALPIYPKAEAHCQTNGFTPLGLTLINEMMSLGMIIDLGHTPKPALNQLMPILVENNYPAVHTHGGDQSAIKAISGMSARGLGSACRDEEGNSKLQQSFEDLATLVHPKTGLPQKGLSYDFNGFAGYNKPRFGELSKCEQEQNDPLEYPFTSFGGDIVFDKPQTGNQMLDFNKHGLANIGLYPDLIEEARRSGASKEGITSLFKTAEAYIQIWERAEQKSLR